MQDLTLVGVHDDGEHLLLTSSDGQRYRVLVDEAMRAAVRRDRPRLGQLQIQLDGRLRPRDIQARIRAGESAEQVAEDSQLPLDYVRRYEGPVLAEREFVVRQARALRIRTPGKAEEAPTLDDLVASRLSAREVDPADAAWDAWRTEDGTWAVTVTFTAGARERRARWTYDAQVRQLTARDDEARWLTEEEPASAPAAATHRRLVPIRAGDPQTGTAQEHVYDVDADGGVQHQPAWPTAATVDLLDTLSQRRGRRQRPVIDHDQMSLDEDDDPGTRPTRKAPSSGAGLPPAAHPPASRPELADDAEVLTLPEPAADGGSDPQNASEQETETIPASAGSAVSSPTKPAATAPAQPAPGRRGKRASVPSWDDIVFGGRRE